MTVNVSSPKADIETISDEMIANRYLMIIPDFIVTNKYNEFKIFLIILHK